MLKNTLGKTNRVRLNLESLEKRLVLDRTLIDMAHVHMELHYDGSALTVVANDTATGVLYDPADVLLYVNENTRDTQPAGWDFIGAGDGNTYWHLTQNVDPSILTLALDASAIPAGSFDTYTPYDPRIGRAGEWIKYALKDVQGPGDLSIWQNNQAPNQWWASTVDGGRTFDPALYIEPGGHNHYNFGFTATGTYMVTFEASAFVGGHGLPLRSGDVTFCFGVEDTSGCDPQGKPGPGSGLSPASFASDPALVSASLLPPVSQGFTPAPVHATGSFTEPRTPTAPWSATVGVTVGLAQPGLMPAIPLVRGVHAVPPSGDIFAFGMPNELT